MALTTDDKINQALLISSLAGGGGNRPGEDGPYRPPNPDEVPGVPPGYPNIPKPKIDLAHGGTQDGRHVAPTQTYTEKTGAVQLPDGNWLMPTKDGKYSPANDEELIEIQYQFEHEHKPSGWDVQGDGWNQASLYMGEQFPNKFDKILNPKGDYSKPTLDMLRQGVEEKKRTGAI